MGSILRWRGLGFRVNGKLPLTSSSLDWSLVEEGYTCRRDLILNSIFAFNLTFTLEVIMWGIVSICFFWDERKRRVCYYAIIKMCVECVRLVLNVTL